MPFQLLFCVLPDEIDEDMDDEIDEDFPSANRSSRHGSRRKKRSPFQEHFIEIMVVADRKMVEYHGSNLIFYVLSLMSSVSIPYQ